MITDTVALLLHGKWSYPNSVFWSALDQELLTHCIKTEHVHMPWSAIKQYDQTYEDLLYTLANKIKEYRQQGFKKIILIGHSFGANCTLVYQSVYGDADILVCVAPGHSPERTHKAQRKRQYQIVKAQTNIATALEQTPITFNDINCERTRDLTVPSNIFYSYFNPAGLANMLMTSKKIKSTRPTLYIEARSDYCYRGPKEIFDQLPMHPASCYVLINANHVTVIEKAKKNIIEWLKKVI